LILSEIAETVGRASRNICHLRTIKADGLNIHDILAANKIIITNQALSKVQEVYGE
jgi:large subunit ribosomal protein L4